MDRCVEGLCFVGVDHVGQARVTSDALVLDRVFHVGHIVVVTHSGAAGSSLVRIGNGRIAVTRRRSLFPRVDVVQKVGCTIPQIDRIYARSESQGDEKERLVKTVVVGDLAIFLSLDRTRRIVLLFKEFCKRPSIDLRCI